MGDGIFNPREKNIKIQKKNILQMEYKFQQKQKQSIKIKKKNIITGNKVFARKMNRVYLSLKTPYNWDSYITALGFNSLYGKEIVTMSVRRQ